MFFGVIRISSGNYLCSIAVFQLTKQCSMQEYHVKRCTLKIHCYIIIILLLEW